MSSESKPYTKEEIIKNLLDEMYKTNRFYEALNKRNGEKYNGESIAFNFFAFIDGETLNIPAFYIDATVKNKSGYGEEENEMGLGDGELHSLILRKNEELQDKEDKGYISTILRSFIRKIQQLIKDYDNGQIKESDELVARIFELIDKGYESGDKVISFEMKACPHEEDKEEAIEEGENYYPEKGENIAGALADTYRAKYLSKKPIDVER